MYTDHSSSFISRATKFILKSGDDCNARLSKLHLQSLYVAETRFVRNAVSYIIDGHYNIDFSAKIVFCRGHNAGHSLRNNDSLDLAHVVHRRTKYYMFLRTVVLFV